MPHPLVDQMRFTRAELRHCLEGVSDEDAQRRLGQMNSIGWIVGHLANHEQNTWLRRAQGKVLYDDFQARFGFGCPPSTPPLSEMWAAWREITAEADAYLDTLTSDVMLTHYVIDGQAARESVGTTLQRVIYHYWFHIGEAHAIRQSLGHKDLPQFVGDFAEAVFRAD